MLLVTTYGKQQVRVAARNCWSDFAGHGFT